MVSNTERLDALQGVLGVSFNNKAIFQEALTHSSFVNENPVCISNERLEFLGDAVLGLALAQKLFQDYQELPEGDLTQLRSRLVCRTTLAEIAMDMDLGSYLYLGKGEESSGGRQKTINLAGAVEAILAAVFLDLGWETALACTLRIFATELVKIKREHNGPDYKSRLQELIQMRFKVAPSYTIVNTVGPDHDRQFTAEATVGDEVLAVGSGRSKKLAESEAARLALKKMGDVFTD
jgi:ribonuclease-3